MGIREAEEDRHAKSYVLIIPPDLIQPQRMREAGQAGKSLQVALQAHQGRHQGQQVLHLREHGPVLRGRAGLSPSLRTACPCPRAHPSGTPSPHVAPGPQTVPRSPAEGCWPSCGTFTVFFWKVPHLLKAYFP